MWWGGIISAIAASSSDNDKTSKEANPASLTTPQTSAAQTTTAETNTAQESKSGGDSGNKFSASVTAPPSQQVLGQEYVLEINITNRGEQIQDFCFDFDEKGAWIIKMPPLVFTEYADDVFCTNLDPGSQTIKAYLTAGELGTHTLQLLLGEGDVHKESNKAFVTDDAALSWEQEFVIA